MNVTHTIKPVIRDKLIMFKKYILPGLMLALYYNILIIIVYDLYLHLLHFDTDRDIKNAYYV